MQNILHGNIGLIIALGVIVVLVITIICLLVGRVHDNKSERRELKANERENRRRKREGCRIKEEIEAEFKSKCESLEQLKQSLRSGYKEVSKTYLDISRNSNQNLFYTLQQLFELKPDDRILYCRRYERTFGSDSFFIIMEDKIGYAPRKEALPLIDFDEIDNINGTGGYIKLMSNDGEVGYVEPDDFTYNGSGDKLAFYLNRYIKKYKSEFDIYLDACMDALGSKATPILPELISKLENYSPLWAAFVRAEYKYLLCEDGISILDNCREASYDIESILSDLKDEKSCNLYNAALVVKAKIKLMNNEDHMEIKKIIDTVLGNKEISRFITDEANDVRRKLTL